MSDHYDQREAMYALYAEKAFPDPISPLTSRERVATALKQFSNAVGVPVWRPITEHQSDSMAYLVTAKNKYGAWREPISAFMDAAGGWRLLGSKDGMTRLSFSPTYFMDLPPMPGENSGEKG